MGEALEANYDGLVGPTHNYGGLSAGNFASERHSGDVSNPRAAALQGLAKMRALHDMGLVQGVLPPQERPSLPLLHAAGFSGSPRAMIEDAWRVDPRLVRNACSSAAMWAANAATVSPSADTADGRVHFTPANLVTMLHRSIEAETTQRALARAFPDPDHFVVHDALPHQRVFADEGAANHMRLCAGIGEPGVEIFVHGRDGYEHRRLRVPVRHTRQVGEAIARRHGLADWRVAAVQQSDEALEAGAFHNDVVAVAHEDVIVCHEAAFADREAALAAIARASDGLFEPQVLEVAEAELALEDAIATYLFNSQLVRAPGADRLTLVAPAECEAHPDALAACRRLTEGNGPVGYVAFVDVRQSMNNGGGPACLRLRVVLTKAELAAANPAQIFDDALEAALTSWIERRYRDALAPDDLGDPDLAEEAMTALDELTGLLGLGADFYNFQREAA